MTQTLTTATPPVMRHPAGRHHPAPPCSRVRDGGQPSKGKPRPLHHDGHSRQPHHPWLRGTQPRASPAARPPNNASRRTARFPPSPQEAYPCAAIARSIAMHRQRRERSSHQHKCPNAILARRTATKRPKPKIPVGADIGMWVLSDCGPPLRRGNPEVASAALAASGSPRCYAPRNDRSKSTSVDTRPDASISTASLDRRTASNPQQRQPHSPANYPPPTPGDAAAQSASASRYPTPGSVRINRAPAAPSFCRKCPT